MAAPIWQQKLREKLNNDPMKFVGDSHVIKHVRCFKPEEKQGKKVTLRLVVNYSFNTCAECKVTIR